MKNWSILVQVITSKQCCLSCPDRIIREFRLWKQCTAYGLTGSNSSQTRSQSKIIPHHSRIFAQDPCQPFVITRQFLAESQVHNSNSPSAHPVALTRSSTTIPCCNQLKFISAKILRTNIACKVQPEPSAVKTKHPRHSCRQLRQVRTQLLYYLYLHGSKF